MQIGQRLRVLEPCGFRHEALDELQHAVGAVDEAAEHLVRIDAARCAAAFVEPGLGARGVLGRRQKEEGQVVGALEVSALLLELRLALGVDQRRDRIRERALRIVLRRVAARLDEDRPAGAETAQRIVEPRGRADQLGRRCASRGPARGTAPCAGSCRPC